MSLPSQRIRLHVNCTTRKIGLDVLTDAEPRILKPGDTQFEIALFDDDADDLKDLAGLDQLTLTIKAKDPRTGLAVMQQTLGSGDLNPGLTLEDWQAGGADACHAKFNFTAAETNVELDADETEFYVVIAGLSDDDPVKEIPFANGVLVIEESGAFTEPPASVTNDLYYTAAQSDARYLLAADLTGKVNRSGDTMTGPLVLDDDPATALGAATKQYVDAEIAAANADFVPLAGGTMTGALVLSGAPTIGLHPATKTYADLKLALSGGTMTGALVLSGAPTVNLHAATKLYVDTADALKLSLAGGTMTGALVLSGAPTSNLHAATKLYVDTAVANLVASSPSALDTLNELAAALGNDANFSTTIATSIGLKLALAGGTMTGALTLSGAPTSSLHAATKAYADLMLPLAGGTMTGALVLSGAPTTGLHPATKTYTDAADALKLNLTGGALSGSLSFSGTGHAGLRVNNLTSTQITALGAPADGFICYDTTLSQFKFREASTWKTLSAGGGGTGWLSGSTDPDDGDGADGNYYLKDDGSVWFKTSGTWSLFVAARLPLSGGTLSGALIFEEGLAPAIEFAGSDWIIKEVDDAGDRQLEFNHTGGVTIFSLRDSGVWFQGTKILVGQQPAIADATDNASAILRLNDLLAAIRTHGLIAT